MQDVRLLVQSFHHMAITSVLFEWAHYVVTLGNEHTVCRRQLQFKNLGISNHNGKSVTSHTCRLVWRKVSDKY